MGRVIPFRRPAVRHPRAMLAYQLTAIAGFTLILAPFAAGALAISAVSNALKRI